MKKLLLGISSFILIISLAISVMATSNISHDKLMSQSEYDRKMILGIAVLTYNYKCDCPKESFFQGFDLIETAYWNLSCEDGNCYRITIKNDAEGLMDVVPCRDLYPTETPCFQKFD